MVTPNTITVNVRVEKKILADSVDMHVEIKGVSSISGRSALTKAREIRDMVVALEGIGIREGAIQIVSIDAEVSSGVIAKASSARYHLKIGMPSLEIMPDVLGIVMSCRNARLMFLDWQYRALDEVHYELLSQALDCAKKRASLICNSLDHRNLGVHSLQEKPIDSGERTARVSLDQFAGMRMHKYAAPMTSEDLGVEVTHSKTVSLELVVEYNVEPKTGAGGVQPP